MSTSQIYDCIVVGGGVTGAMTALELSGSGARVALVEKDTIGFEASSRNMGAFGALGKFAVDLAAPSPEGWLRYRNLLGDTIEYKNGGRLCVAESEEHIPAIDAMIRKGRANNVTLEELDAAQLQQRFPFLSGNEIRGLFAPDDGTLNPATTMASLRDVLMNTPGVTVMENRMALGIAAKKGAVTGVSTDKGMLTSENVLCTGGIWSRRLLDQIGVHIPIQLMTVIHAQTKPLPQWADVFLRGPYYGIRQFRSGEVRISGGFINVGSAHAISAADFRDLRLWLPRLIQNRHHMRFLFDKKLFASELHNFFNRKAPPPRGYEAWVPLAQSMKRFREAQKAVPALADAEFSHVNGGMIDLTPDGLPVLGPVRNLKGLFLATGFSGQGFGLAPVTSQLVAQAILGETPPILRKYRQERFVEEPSSLFPDVG